MSVTLTIRCADSRCATSMSLTGDTGKDIASKLKNAKRSKKGDLIVYCPKCSTRQRGGQRNRKHNGKKNTPRKPVLG